MPVNIEPPAICPLCGVAMTRGSSCLPGAGRIPYGQEAPPAFTSDHCHDCSVAKGAFHHFGCDVEECPMCRGQLLGCDCEPPL